VLRPHGARELDFSLILKGFSETLEELPSKPAENDFVASLEIPSDTPCFAAVRDCFARLDETEETEAFRETLDECMLTTFECVASVEVSDAQRANENATFELKSAITLLRQQDVDHGMDKIVHSLKTAAEAIGKQFPEVARFVKAVISQVMKLLEKYTPVVMEHAKKLGGVASEEVQKGFEILKEHLPTLIRQCKWGASYAGREVQAAAEKIRKELPRLQRLAEGAEKNAAVVLDGLLRNMPRLVDTCKTEIAKAAEERGVDMQKIQGALVVAAALGGGLYWLHHHANEVNQLDLSQMEEKEGLNPVLSDDSPLFLRLHTTEYSAIVKAYDSGRWEDLGRAIGLVLQ
jgi:hypothetical protein